MAAPVFSSINTPDKNLQLIQDNITKTTTPLLAMPMVGGNTLTGIALVAGQDNQVPHKLGRTSQYFIVIQQSADSTVWQVSANSTYIVLRCSADCTVGLWVN